MLLEVFVPEEGRSYNGGTYRAYIARITGRDERFDFKRQFLRPVLKEGDRVYDIVADGIYEESVKCFEQGTGRFRCRNREFFVFHGEEYYVISPSEVLEYVDCPEAAALRYPA